MGNAQPTTQTTNSVQYVVVRQSDGSVVVMEKQELQQLLLNS